LPLPETPIESSVSRRLQAFASCALALHDQRPAPQAEVVLVLLDDLDAWQPVAVLVIADCAVRAVQFLREVVGPSGRPARRKLRSTASEARLRRVTSLLVVVSIIHRPPPCTGCFGRVRRLFEVCSIRP